VSRKTHTTAAVLIPPFELWPPIQAIRQDHDRHSLRWVMPHITLLYPFRPREEFAAVAERFSVQCEKTEPFAIELVEFRAFHHGQGRYTLWLAPEPKDAVAWLQAVLENIVPDCDDVRRYPGGFTPHLSVGQVQGRAAMVQLRAALQAAWRPVSFTAGEVSLLWRGEPPDDVFRVVQTVRVGK
jgi:2'-5' RNA ligase